MNPEGVLLAPGAEPGAGAGNKRETKKKIKSFNGNINCCSCGFYKTHKLFAFLFFFFFLNYGLARAPFARNIQVVWDLPSSYGTQD